MRATEVGKEKWRIWHVLVDGVKTHYQFNQFKNIGEFRFLCWNDSVMVSPKKCYENCSWQMSASISQIYRKVQTFSHILSKWVWCWRSDFDIVWPRSEHIKSDDPLSISLSFSLFLFQNCTVLEDMILSLSRTQLQFIYYIMSAQANWCVLLIDDCKIDKASNKDHKSRTIKCKWERRGSE